MSLMKNTSNSLPKLVLIHFLTYWHTISSRTTDKISIKVQKLKNLKKSAVFKRKTAVEQSAELDQRFIAYLHKIEKDKLHYFILAHEQENNVLIVNAPSKKKEQDQFLGYKWSKAKGREGIQYQGGATVNDIITPLFDPTKLDHDTKINTAIKRNFIGEATDPLPEHCQYAKLTDMLDFSRTDFNKAISLNPKQNIDIETEWELVKLGEVVETQYGYTAKAEDEGNVRYLRITDITEDGQLKNTDKKYINPSEQIVQDYTLNPNDIVIARSGSTGRMLLYKGIDEQLIFASYLVRLKVSATILPEYIFAYHKTTDYWKQVDALTTTLAQPNLNAERMKQIKIPLPPLEEQQQIVDECEAVDQDTNQARQAITRAKQEIERKLQAVINVEHNMKKIGDVYNTTSGGTPLSHRKEYYENGTIPWINSGEVSKKEINFADSFITELGLNNSNAKLFPPGTVLLAMYGATAGKVALLNIEASTNQALCALLPTEEIVPKFLVLVLESMYQYLLNLRTGVARDNLSQEKIRNIRIPVPRLDIQQQLTAEVEQLEAEITQAQAVIDNATERKNAILAKYL